MFQRQVEDAVRNLDLDDAIVSRVHSVLDETQIKLVDQDNEHEIKGKLFPQ